MSSDSLFHGIAARPISSPRRPESAQTVRAANRSAALIDDGTCSFLGEADAGQEFFAQLQTSLNGVGYPPRRTECLQSACMLSILGSCVDGHMRPELVSRADNMLGTAGRIHSGHERRSALDT